MEKEIDWETLYENVGPCVLGTADPRTDMQILTAELRLLRKAVENLVGAQRNDNT